MSEKLCRRSRVLLEVLSPGGQAPAWGPVLSGLNLGSTTPSHDLCPHHSPCTPDSYLLLPVSNLREVFRPSLPEIKVRARAEQPAASCSLRMKRQDFSRSRGSRRRPPASRDPRVSLALGVTGGTPSTQGPHLPVPIPSPSFPLSPLSSHLSRLAFFSSIPLSMLIIDVSLDFRSVSAD